ncbi:UNKNOWN [Stylonychia lemnae]|uniref:50S ribosomal protein L35 n=1 Tax=Stylonychia lemnae TaxID=5949 RepID=A0A078A3S8_STYLE|nr:UNKNOWN [Stylonychia lemnae]|eukprot:CDW76183.1 UNKNOWN [Stylonychia lemnae]
MMNSMNSFSQQYFMSSLLSAQRGFLTLNNKSSLLQTSTLTQVNERSFSIISRRTQKKYARTKKYKLKTKKAFQKRFRIGGSLRDRTFKFHALGFRHLNRNKTNKNLGRKRGRLLHHRADINKAKKYMPYFKSRKSTKL